MAYDLLSKRQTPRDFSLGIEDDGGSLVAELLPAALDAVCVLGGEALGPAGLALAVAGHVAGLKD